MEQTIQPRDMYFQCRMMGSTPPPEHRAQLAQWYQAARANPARVEVGVARIQALLDVLPTDADVAASAMFSSLAQGNASAAQVAAFTMLRADDPCPCESGKTCAACDSQFTMRSEREPKWTDTYGKSATICSACYPKMTPAHAIIGGRIVETLPMPDEIRRGMVFWSKSWDHPDIHDGMLVTGYPRPMFGSDDPGWISTGQHFGFYPRNGHFLGCDPAHASPEDCERYGIAPGFEVKP